MDDGSMIELTVRIDRNTGDAIFDFTNSDPEVYGNLNAPKAVTFSAVIYCLRCLIGYDVPLNQGCLTPIYQTETGNYFISIRFCSSCWRKCFNQSESCRRRFEGDIFIEIFFINLYIKIHKIQLVRAIGKKCTGQQYGLVPNR